MRLIRLWHDRAKQISRADASLAIHALTRPWRWVKLAAVAPITANALPILRPVGLKRVAFAQNLIDEDRLQPAFQAAGATEDIFGTLNLALVRFVIVLSIAKRAPFFLRLQKIYQHKGLLDSNHGGLPSFF